MNEKQFQSAVIKLAKLRGFLVYHPAVSQFSEPGFPDLTMVREDRLLFRELKAGRRKVTPAQERWLDLLRLSGHDAAVWYPADLDSGRIAAELAPVWSVA